MPAISIYKRKKSLVRVEDNKLELNVSFSLTTILYNSIQKRISKYIESFYPYISN